MILRLDDDVLSAIVNYLDLQALRRADLTCRRLYNRCSPIWDNLDAEIEHEGKYDAESPRTRVLMHRSGSVLAKKIEPSIRLHTASFLRPKCPGCKIFPHKPFTRPLEGAESRKKYTFFVRVSKVLEDHVGFVFAPQWEGFVPIEETLRRRIKLRMFRPETRLHEIMMTEIPSTTDMWEALEEWTPQVAISVVAVNKRNLHAELVYATNNYEEDHLPPFEFSTLEFPRGRVMASYEGIDEKESTFDVQYHAIY